MVSNQCQTPFFIIGYHNLNNFLSYIISNHAQWLVMLLPINEVTIPNIYIVELTPQILLIYLMCWLELN